MNKRSNLNYAVWWAFTEATLALALAAKALAIALAALSAATCAKSSAGVGVAHMFRK